MQTDRLVRHLILVNNDCSVLKNLERERESQDSNWFGIRVDFVKGCCAHFIWCKCVIYIKSACLWTSIYVRSGCDQKKSISFTPWILYSM